MGEAEFVRSPPGPGNLSISRQGNARVRLRGLGCTPMLADPQLGILLSFARYPWNQLAGSKTALRFEVTLCEPCVLCGILLV